MLPFDPFAPLSTLVRSPLRSMSFVPPVDVAVSESDVVLTMDLPGFTSEDVSIEFMDDLVTIRGERGHGDAPEGTQFAHVERGFGRFERSLRLPPGVDPDAVTASLEHGVLSLIIPKPAERRPKAIAIASGDRPKELAAA